MINAEQAMKNASESKNNTLSTIMNNISIKIEQACKKGDFSVQYTVSYTDDVEAIMTELRRHGYKTKHEQHSSQRDDWNYIFISWN